MIELEFSDVTEFKKLTDEEQSNICMAVIKEYDYLRKPLHDMAVKDYYDKQIKRIPFVFHDWQRVRNNLKYAAEPNKPGEDKYFIRWKLIWDVYGQCEFLAYINTTFDLIESDF